MLAEAYIEAHRRLSPNYPTWPDESEKNKSYARTLLIPIPRAQYEFQKKYWLDPANFVIDCIDWSRPAWKGPTDYQLETMMRFIEKGRVSVRGPHTIGKTAEAAWLVLFFSLCRDGRDWKIITTASAWTQLKNYLWPEIHKWSRFILWEKIGREPFLENNELLDLNIKLMTGQAFAVASVNSAFIEGAHADHLMYIFDEAKEILDETFDAAEGAFAGASANKESQEAYALSMSTPGDPIGRFYEIQARKPGFDDWDVRHVTKDEAIAAGRMTEEWADQRRKQWGEDHFLYKRRVLGEFAAQDEEATIPLAWIELAIERWKTWRDEGFPGTPTGLGIDVGGDVGGAETAIAKVFDRVRIKEIVAHAHGDPETATMRTAGEIKGLLDAAANAGLDVRAFVDSIGLGAGVIHRLKEQEVKKAVAFNSAEGTEHRDKSDQWGFPNNRSAGWWTVREMLEPDSGFDVMLPDDDVMLGGLTLPQYRILSGARIQIEKKEDIIKRYTKRTSATGLQIKRMLDRADSVIYALSGPTLYKPVEFEIVSMGGV